MAQDMVSLGERRRSKKSLRPNVIFSGVSGLVFETGRGGRPSKTELEVRDWELGDEERRKANTGPRLKDENRQKKMIGRSRMHCRQTQVTLMVICWRLYFYWFLK